MSDTAVLTARANPYVGPRAFRTGEQLYGRDRELRRLLDLLIAERIVLLFAPSGAGKTSLVQAALIPRLAAEGFAVLPPIRVNQELSAQLAPAPVSSPPPADTGDELLAALIGQASTPTANNTTPRRNGTTYTALTGPNRYLLSAMLSLEEARPPEARMPVADLAALSFDGYLQRREAEDPQADGLVLVFDQFEEILTLNTADRPAKEQFFTQVGAALLRPNRWALFSMREDFVGAMEPYQRFVPTQLANTFRLDLLGVRAAREAMQLPVQAQGVVFTDAAAAQLVDNLRLVRVLRPDGVTEEQLGPFVEPVQLQVVCYRLWDGLAPDDGSIDPEDVAALGDVESALTDYYAERVATIAAATGVGERAIRDWCEHSLITEQGIRGQVALGAGGGLPEAVVRALVDAHLVRAEPRRGAVWCELAHDRLINPVREDNARWRSAHLSPLQSQATLWARQDRQQGLLLRGEALAEAERWATTSGAVLTPDEQEFLKASQALRNAEERERRNAQRIRLLAVVSALAAVAAVALAMWAFLLQEQAQRETARAEQEKARAERQAQLAEVRALTNASQVNRGTRPQYAALLAVEAWNRSQGYGLVASGAEEALHQSLAVIAGQPLAGYVERVVEASFTPEGAILGVTADGAIWRWRPGESQGERLAGPRPESDAITTALISEDGSTLITGNWSKAVQLWRTDNLAAEPIAPPPGPVIGNVLLSPNGRWLSYLDGEGRFRLWDSYTPDAPPQTFASETHAAASAGITIYTPDSNGLLLASKEFGVARLDLAAPETAVMLRSELSGWPLVFSPDGRLLVENEGNLARIHALDDAAAPPRELRVPGDNLATATFSPDGRRLAGIVNARFWYWDLEAGDANPTELSNIVIGKENIVPTGRLNFDPSGRLLAAALDDGSTVVWNLDDPLSWPSNFTGEEIPIEKLRFSPDSRSLLGVGESTRLWQLDAGPIHPTELSSTATINRLHLVGENELLGASFDGTLLRWRLDQPTAPPAQVALPTDTSPLAFSPDGRLVVSAEADNTLTLRGTADGALLSALTPGNPSGNTRGVVAVFSPDGQLVAAADQVGRVRVWEIGAPDAPREREQPRERAALLAFTPDGEHLIGAGYDTPLYIWRTDDLTTAPLALRTPGGTGGAGAGVIAISPGGRFLATGGLGGTIWLWEDFLAPEPPEPKPLGGRGQNVGGLAFSPDELHLASSEVMSEQSLRVWRLDQDGASTALLRDGREGSPRALVFAADGQALYTGSDTSEGPPRRWELNPAQLAAQTCAIVGRNMSWDEWEAIDDASEPSYKKTCPTLPISLSLLDEARNLADQGRANEAEALFVAINRLEPGLELDLAFETRQGRREALVRQVVVQTGEGRYAEAVASLAEANQIEPGRTSDYYALSELCRRGVLDGALELVLATCETMLSLDNRSDSRGYESRAIARALSNNLAGAAEDLEQALVLDEQGLSPQDEVARRRTWLEMLRAGQNPFTEEQLAELLLE